MILLLLCRYGNPETLTGHAINLVIIILMMKPIIVIFVMAIITAERLLTY